jgi:predicted DNA-binding ribbon-helix-helix protein
MSDSEKNVNKPILSPISLIKQLRDGKISAANLTNESRIACVEYLTGEGLKKCEIAELLKISTRTVYRDLAQIRKENAISLDAEFVAQHVGELKKRCSSAISNLLKIQNDKKCPHKVKVDAIHKTWLIFKECTQTLQSLYYLPNAATEIRASVDHNFGEPPGFDEITHDLSMLKASMKESGIPDEQITQMLSVPEGLIQRSSASNIIKQVKSKIVEENKND